MNELIFSNNREGIRDFAEMIAALQNSFVRFETSQSGQSLIITIKSGEE